MVSFTVWTRPSQVRRLGGAPPVFGQTGGQIMPTTVLQAPRIFRPCDGPDVGGGAEKSTQPLAQK